MGKTGLHLHDGIDGVVSDKSEDELVTYIAQQTSLRVSVDKPLKIAARGTGTIVDGVVTDWKPDSYSIVA